jgi:hypothetical protein
LTNLAPVATKAEAATKKSNLIEYLLSQIITTQKCNYLLYFSKLKIAD